MYLLIISLLFVLIVWAIERFYLRGNSPAIYPNEAGPQTLTRFTNPAGPGPGHDAVLETVRELNRNISFSMRKQKLKDARTAVDSLSDNREYISEFTPVDAGGIAAEWVIAPGASTTRRLLYIHGGGFILGSAKSHRTITSKFSEINHCAVLAIDYRLLPEHKHMDCVADCRTAYHWILENGPGGPEAISQLFIAGDSAGGNLSLSLIAWIRDHQLRPPDAVVVLSPLTDFTFSGPSIRDNEATDVMLKPVMRKLNTTPKFLKSWVIVWTHHVRPANPVASPLLGDLSNLPPTLVQASEAEMLLDDARRYVYKAHASGSPAKLQTWADMVHVWQIFDPQLPQAGEAWAEIGKFLESQTPS